MTRGQKLYLGLAGFMVLLGMVLLVLVFAGGNAGIIDQDHAAYYAVVVFLPLGCGVVMFNVYLIKHGPDPAARDPEPEGEDVPEDPKTPGSDRSA